jgi:TatD DNase family protein
MLVDSHCHLVNEDYDIKAVVNRAVDAGVKYLIVGGSEREDNKLNMGLINQYDNVYACVGFHPSMASTVTEEDFCDLEKYLKNKKVLAIGEIGLDYYYGKEDINEQKDLFISQLDIAQKYNLPVVIHTRDAFLDTYNILKKYELTGIIHCFSGSLEVAKQYIDLGYYLGIGGVVTFKNSNLKDVIKELGLERIVLETDSPYLSPIRGKKNEPANVKIVCNFLSELLDIRIEKVAEITTNNVSRVLNFEFEKND